MSRTYKDKNYKLLEREAAQHGFLEIDNHSGLAPAEWTGNVTAYANHAGRKQHIHAYTRWHDWRDYENDWYPNWGSRSQLRDRLTVARHLANNGFMTLDWDDPIVYQQRAAWDC